MPQLLHYLKQTLPIDLIQKTRLLCRRKLLQLFRQQDFYQSQLVVEISGSLGSKKSKQPKLSTSASKTPTLKTPTQQAPSPKASTLKTLEFSHAESIHISAPFCPDDVPAAIQQRIGTFEMARPYVYKVDNARLIGDRATGFSSNGQLITETAVPSFYGLEQSTSTRALIKSAFIQNTFIQKVSTASPLSSVNSMPAIDEAFSLVNPWSHNYFHWLIDCLPRLEGSEHYKAQRQSQTKSQTPHLPYQNPNIIIPKHLSQWQADSLRLLGYSPENCIRWNGKGATVNRLIVSSFRRTSLSVLSPAACQWVKNRVINAIQSEKIQANPSSAVSSASAHFSSASLSSASFSPNVVISRRKATGRRLINEDKVMQLLAPLGFVAYTLEEMTFAEQVRLFAQAKTVISPHGAGLVNMIFSTNLHVIELFGSPINPIFFTLAKALTFEYACIPCQTISKKYNTKRNDILVDISKLKNTIENYLH